MRVISKNSPLILQRLEAEILKRYRSVNQFARMNALPSATLWKFFNSRVAINREMYLTILERLGLTEEMFLAGGPPLELSSDQREMLDMMKAMDPTASKALLVHAKIFRNEMAAS